MKRIPLTQGKFALVDDEDFEWLSQWKWYANRHRLGKTFYAVRTIKTEKITVLMHRAILCANNGDVVDHADGDGLNNTRSNIRIGNKSKNGANRGVPSNNSSGYKGVSIAKRSGKQKWFSKITVNQHQISIGFFDSEIEAAVAYNEKAKELFGEFAFLNHIEDD